MHRILIVDDDAQMLELMEQLLQREGYEVLLAASSTEAVKLIERELPSLLIVDLALPDEDGLVLCRKLRRDKHTAGLPIVFMASENAPYTVAEALAAGGDDYIRKPFVVRELMARLRAHLRRTCSCTASSSLPVLQIYSEARTVLVDQRPVALTQVEYELLRHLCQSPKRLHSAQDLLRAVWNYPPDTGDPALVRNHIRNLRRKLEDSPGRPEIIQSRHGRGYTIRAQVQIISEGVPTFA